MGLDPQRRWDKLDLFKFTVAWKESFLKDKPAATLVLGVIRNDNMGRLHLRLIINSESDITFSLYYPVLFLLSGLLHWLKWGQAYFQEKKRNSFLRTYIRYDGTDYWIPRHSPRPRARDSIFAVHINIRENMFLSLHCNTNSTNEQGMDPFCRLEMWCLLRMNL